MDQMVVLEELGRGLMPEPMISTVLLGATALLLGGTGAQKREHLPAIASGARLVALAYQEPGARYELSPRATRGDRAGDGWRLAGTKAHVLDGQVADWLIVTARTAG